MLLPYHMLLGMLGVQPTSGGDSVQSINQGHVYLSWSYEDELNFEREKSKNRLIVYEAAVEAVTHNYYAPDFKVNEAGLNKLKAMARDLELTITKHDKILLKLEIEHIRALQILDDEEAITFL